MDHDSGLQILENLLHENDVKGAVEFAKRVQTSSPKLKRLSCFLAQIVVQVSVEDEETDWYSVLGVDPSADMKTIKKEYARLAESINLTESSEAHKLLNKAWATLSDKDTRNDYDLRRRSRDVQQNAFAAVGIPSSGAKDMEYVPENHIPLGSDGQRDLNLGSDGKSRAEKVGSSESSKGTNRKNKVSDVERNDSRKKARNLDPTQLHEQNAAVMDRSGPNDATVEGPEEDGFKTMEVPDSNSRNLDGHRTQDSHAEDQLNAFYTEIEDDFAYLLDPKIHIS